MISLKSLTLSLIITAPTNNLERGLSDLVEYYSTRSMKKLKVVLFTHNGLKNKA
jgi:hypothetical protein